MMQYQYNQQNTPLHVQFYKHDLDILQKKNFFFFNFREGKPSQCFLKSKLHHSTWAQNTQKTTLHVSDKSLLTVSGSPWRACRIKLLTTLPSFICIRGPKVLNILATLTSTPSCRWRKKQTHITTLVSISFLPKLQINSLLSKIFFKNSFCRFKMHYFPTMKHF